MPYKVQPAAEIKQLTREVHAKKEELQLLERRREQLLCREALLKATLKALNEVGLPVSRSAAQTTTGQYAEATSVAAGTCSNQRAPFCSSNGTLSSTSAVQRHCSTIACPEDPLSLLSLRPDEQHQQLQEGTVTLAQMREDYQRLTSTLAAHVSYITNEQQQQQQQEQLIRAACTNCCHISCSSHSSCSSSSAAERESALEIIQQALTKFWASMNSFLLAGKADITHKFILSNVVTGAQIEQHDTALYEALIEQLQLSSTQQQRILASMDLFRQVTEPVVKARQQMQLQLGSRSSASNMHNSNAATAAGGAMHITISGPAAPAGGMQLLHGDAFRTQAAVLQQQERLWESDQQRRLQLMQLSKLLRKEFLLKHCACTCIQGCLTWGQMAQCVLACFPYVVSPIALVQALQSKQSTP